jgi:Cof subfamily protein (haloacid dehalogenase superfamily)
LGKFDRVLLASDFDDTLYNSRREVSAENIAAIEYFIREGGYFTVSTGRMGPAFAPYLHMAPTNAPVILANGALLYDYAMGKPLIEFHLDAQAAVHLSEMALALPRVGIEVYPEMVAYVQNPNEHTARHVKRIGADWVEMPLLEMPQPWHKAVMLAARSDLEEAQRYLTQRWGDLYEVIFSNDVILECTAKGANKGCMVLRLAELLGVERKNTYCVGDNQNDLPMLAVSAIPFAPSNCADTVRESNPRIVRDCDEHAVAHVIEILDELYVNSSN